MIKLFKTLLVLGCLLIGLTWPAAAAPPLQRPSDQQLIDQIKRDTRNKVRIAYHADTGKVSFIGADLASPISQPTLLPRGANPVEAARGFLSKYGQLFGLTDPANELNLMRERSLKDGRAFVRFQQHYQGIPILAGELIVQTNVNRNIISANGEILPELELDTTPHIQADAARQTALTQVAKNYGLSVNDLTSTEPELWIYDPALLGGPGRRLSTLVWRIEVTSLELRPIRELVLVDAQRGFVTLHFNQVDTAKNRVVHDNNNNPALGLPGNGPIRSEGQGPSGITDVNRAYDYAGHTYDFYLNEHGRDSLNDAGMTLLSTTRYCEVGSPCPYPNAFWNGTQMAYGQGFANADDVVGHELTHGVTEFSSSLFYFYQSGAINESFSDVWGEFIDQTNGAGTDTAAVKWLMGENVPGFGAIRNMKDPPAFNDPDRMLSTNYYCDEDDNGGVHFNSGVNNKAVYLLTDGATFNGQTVTGLGITKVADLYYEVQTNLLTSGSNYKDLYNALIQAGINLGYSTADQQEILDALNAVQMNQRPCSDPPEASICPTGLSPNHLFFDNFEAGFSNWLTSGSAIWSPGNFYASSGVNHLDAINDDQITDGRVFMAAGVTLPANAYLHFKHDWGFEDSTLLTYDGGVVEYSTNGGSTWNDAGSLFTDNGYNGTINSCCGNPLSGRSAFTREGHGYTASRLNLNSLAGQNVRFRFRIGTDSAFGAWGWDIDDVRIYTCSSGPIGSNVFLPIILK
jgi:Zn-dependent metalloprotease